MLSSTRRWLALLSWFGAVAAASSCGARSELLVPEVDSCEPFTTRAMPTQLDLFLMVDSSGSMARETDAGTTKWQDITQAVEAFVVDPALAGTGATMTFFPERHPDVPGFCTSDGMCGEADACFSIGICWPSAERTCVDAEDCTKHGFPGDSCAPLGQCQNKEELCYPNEGAPNCEGAPCVDLGACTNRTVCEAEAYELGAPTPLPGSANSIINAMSQREPVGGTPTWPAMQGAVQSARDWAQSNPTRKSVIVLATDGLPSSCEPDIQPVYPDEFPVDNVIDTVNDGVASGIGTFVIGVFTPEDAEVAQSNLDAVAAAGSDSPAFILTTAGDVTAQFLAALQAVRAQATNCVFAAEWQTPAPNNLFQLFLEQGDWNLTVPFLPVANSCGEGDGFYFETPPAEGATGVQIALCPTTCERLTDEPATIELQALCQ